jgi:hypothetical protein
VDKREYFKTLKFLNLSQQSRSDVNKTLSYVEDYSSKDDARQSKIKEEVKNKSVGDEACLCDR